jgi:hypothetical protein
VSTTDINTFDVVVELQHSVPGAASAAVVRFSHGREAVWLTVDGEVHKGALSAAASHVIATAAQTARSKGVASNNKEHYEIGGFILAGKQA